MKTSKRILLLICAASVLVFIYSFYYSSYSYFKEEPSKDASDFIDITYLNWNESYPILWSKLLDNKFQTGVPFAYTDHVDFRIIVLTYSRSQSLAILLECLNDLELDGFTGALEIWIDRNKDNNVNRKVLKTALDFVWKRGQSTVHLQPEHVGIYGQWIDTWRPRVENKTERQEISLILEDDMIVSPFVYRWLRAIHDKYGKRPDFAGASTNAGEQMQAHNNGARIIVDDPAFMYVCIGTWGFSPSPRVWKDFQDWYHANLSDSKSVSTSKNKFHPYVPGTRPNDWYMSFEQVGREDTMWEMWFIFYSNEKSLMTIYSNVINHNLPDKKCPWDMFRSLCQPFLKAVDKQMCFGYNRQEIGLHYNINDLKLATCPLIMQWSDDYAKLPEELIKFDWYGKEIKLI